MFPRVSVKFRLTARNDLLKKAPAILGTEMRGALSAIGKRLKASAEARMHLDKGQERKSLKTVVSGSNLNYNVVVYSTLLQAFIDAYGMRPGHRVPFGRSSRLFRWSLGKAQGPYTKLPTQPAYAGAGPKRQFVGSVQRVRGLHNVIRRSRITTQTKVKANKRIKAKNQDALRLSFLTARAIYRRGLEASHWNKKALEANKSRIIRELKNAMTRAANRIKRG